MLEILANLISALANDGAGAASVLMTYEPEIPECLEMKRNNVKGNTQSRC